MPTIEQYSPWVAEGAFVWDAPDCEPGWWLVAIHGLGGGTLTDMKPEDPDHVGPGQNSWQLLAQIDAGIGLPKWRVWARKVTAPGTYQAGFPGPDSGLDIYSHFLVLSGCRDAEDAADVFLVGAASSASSDVSQAVSLFQPDETGSNLAFAAWLAGAVTNYTVSGSLSANSELDGATSTSGSGTGVETGYGVDTLTSTTAAGVPWAAVTLIARAPAAGSVTFPDEPLRMRAEIAPGADPGQDPAYWAGLWTDISNDVLMRDGGVTIGRGRQDETSQVTPSTMALTVDNEAGQFVRLNPLSPYYGKLTTNLPIQLWIDPGDGWRLRYRGFVSEYPPRSQGGEVDENMPLQAAGITRRLSRGRVLNSPLYRQIIAKGGLSGYWPLETDLASGIGGSSMRVTSGSFAFNDNGPPGSAGAISTDRGGIATAPVVGMPDVEGWIVSFWLTVPDDFDTSTDVSMVVTWSTPGSSLDRWVCYMNSSSPGHLIIGAFAIGDEAAADTSANLVGSGPYHIAAIAAPDGANVSFGIQVTDVAGNVTRHQTGGSIPADIVSPITAVGLNASADLVGSDFKGAIDHLMVIADPDPTTSDLWGTDSQLLPASQGFAGERAADRIRRLGGEENVPIVVVGDDGASEPMGPQPVARFVDILQDIEDTDGGMLYERRDARLGYQTRAARYNASPAITLAGMADVTMPFEPVDDDQHIVNDFTASRANGGAVRLSDDAHITAHGQYADSATLNVAADDQLADQAGWRVHEGTAEGLRYPSIAPNLNGSPDLIPAWTALDVGQPLALTDPGRDLPPGTINTVIEGYTETIDVVSWTATANCTPGDPWRVIVLNDATLGRADTSGSALASSATTTATSISVATMSGPLWTTDPADLPISIIVGGEAMTVLDPTTRITDSFTRSVSSGWGTATSGQAWAVSGGTAANFSATGSTGRVSCTDVTTRRFTSLGSGITAASLAVTVTVPVTALTDTITAGVVLRYTDDNNHYLFQLTFATDGTITVEILKRVSGTYTSLGATSGVTTYSPGAPVRIRAQAVGTALGVRAWPAAATEPGEWQATAIDSTYSSGKVGTKTSLGAGNTNSLPVAIDYDDLDMLTPAITGTSSPQTVKVVRSINGVVKTHGAGEDVRLATTPILSF